MFVFPYSEKICDRVLGYICSTSRLLGRLDPPNSSFFQKSMPTVGSFTAQNDRPVTPKDDFDGTGTAFGSRPES
jgi:hypothetical protein